MIEIPGPQTMIERYGLNYNPVFKCHNNALTNSLRIAMAEAPSSPFPRIYEVRFSWRFRDVHAYILWQNTVLNDRVTAYAHRFPNFGPEALLAQGKDMTGKLISWTYDAFYAKAGERIAVRDDRLDKFALRLTIDTEFSGDKHERALEILTRLHR